nr:hypothetical protein [uncultured Arsenicibacter sp.]
MKTFIVTLLLLPAIWLTARAQNLTTADEVLNAYYKAVGGKKALLDIKDISWEATTGNDGAGFPTVNKFKPPLKQVTTLRNAQGQVMYTFIADGKDAFMAFGDNKTPMSRGVMDRFMITMQMMPELYLASQGIKTTFAGKETVEGKEAYKLTHTMPDGSTWNTCYDTQTGLKVKLSVPGQSVGDLNLYSDYREVKGIKLPFMIRSGNNILKIESYQLNTGISDAEFVIP